MYYSTAYNNTHFSDDPSRVACPDFADHIPANPSTGQLCEILECDIIFWEAFSADGITQVYDFPNGRFQEAANRACEGDFQRDINDAIAAQDFEGLGRLVSHHMLNYAEKIHEIRS